MSANTECQSWHSVLTDHRGCQICMEEITGEVQPFSCGHIACQECLCDWIQTQLCLSHNTSLQCFSCRREIISRAEGHRLIGNLEKTEVVVNENGYQISVTYLNDIRHGLSQTRTPSGKIVNESFYAEGVLHGRNRIWYESDLEELILQSDICYEGGLLHGMSLSYDQEGRIFCERNYEQGLFHGISRFWDSSGGGVLTAERFYQNGLLVYIFS